jgi:CubicO group peptidase (beta-lactamase class C family)
MKTPFKNAGFGWATDAQGTNIGGGNLRLRPADMLKFGQLYLDRQVAWQTANSRKVGSGFGRAKPRLQRVRVDVVDGSDPYRRFGERGDGIGRSADRCRS